MACNTTPTGSSNKLRVLLIPHFSTSHILPFTQLAIRLAAANEAVEATIGVTPESVPIVRSLLDREHNVAAVKIATYPFPVVEGISQEEAKRAATSESVLRPVQETFFREQSPDAIISDQVFTWNDDIIAGVPCVAFSVIGAFSSLALRHLMEGVMEVEEDASLLEVPRFPGPCIRIPRRELPAILRTPKEFSYTCSQSIESFQANCFGLAINTPSELEKEYCEVYKREGYVKRAYFLGPVALPLPSHSHSEKEERKCIIMDWLDSRPSRSVVYISFGTVAQVKDAQLDEIAGGLETSGKPFLWVVRGKEEWSPPAGWEERVKDMGFIIRDWAPQTAILGHPALGAFVTQCGWNSIQETVAAGVPVLTWPLAFEQFLTERLVTEVLGIGERLWPDGAGLRSQIQEEHEVIPGQHVARALTGFMRPGGPGDAARIKVMELAAKVHAAVAQGGSSHRDLHRLTDDLLMAAEAKRRRT